MGKQMNMADDETFGGAKMALFLGGRLVVILRDDLPDLPYANHWDLPGGGREGSETAFECVRRECLEELGLEIAPASVLWKRAYHTDGTTNWLFVVGAPAETSQDIVFGDEGQRWTLMDPQVFLSHPMAVPRFQDRLRDYLEERGNWPK